MRRGLSLIVSRTVVPFLSRNFGWKVALICVIIFLVVFCVVDFMDERKRKANQKAKNNQEG